MQIEVSVLCVIPARGGSQGIRLKNLEKVHGRSLLDWAIRSTKSVSEINEIVVSTDHPLIREEAQRCGVIVPEFRPELLSGNTVPDYEVLRYELGKAEFRFNREFQVIVMLQPTSPVRSQSEISFAINEISLSKKSACWSITEVDVKFHYKKQLRIDLEGRLTIAAKGPLVVARQELEQTYIRNGVVYAIGRETLLRDPQLMGVDCSYLKLEGYRPNIDTHEDLIRVRDLTEVDKFGNLILKGTRV